MTRKEKDSSDEGRLLRSSLILTNSAQLDSSCAKFMIMILMMLRVEIYDKLPFMHLWFLARLPLFA
jgi:hypothetical protein